LRWAPLDPVQWKLANANGYTVERYTIVKNKIVIADPKLTKLNISISPLVPQQLHDWEKYSDDKYVGIAAEAIFGDSMEISSNNTDVLAAINQAKDLESRFSFALFCADMSFKVAELSGLTITDNNIKKDEKYLYRIFSNFSNSPIKSDTGLIYVDASAITKLPAIKRVFVDFNNKAATIKWEAEIYKEYYTAYNIERSDNEGKSFSQVNINPVVSMTSSENPELKFAKYIDSIPQNYKDYKYRIIGISPFGDFGPASDTVSGQSAEAINDIPQIFDTKLIQNKYISVGWSFPENQNTNIGGFKVIVSEDIEKNYKVLAEKIAPGLREFQFEAPSDVNYIIIKVVGHDGKEYSSMPKLVQLIDSVPPAIPLGLTGNIDTAGIVHLKWNANEEADLFGYKVYFSNSPEAEFSQITKKAIADTFYLDTVPKVSLSKKIYYKIISLDTRYNESKLSKLLVLDRPDFVPPVAPEFNKVLSSDSSVYIEWKDSPSNDVVNHVLIRSIDGHSNWKVIASFDTIVKANHYNDLDLKSDTVYRYGIFAVDNSKNQSAVENTFTAKLLNKKNREQIAKFKAFADRDNKAISLTWKYDSDNVYKFLIYKAIDNAPLVLYNNVAGTERSYIDEDQRINTKVTYKICALFNDGASSSLSELIIEY